MIIDDPLRETCTLWRSDLILDQTGEHSMRGSRRVSYREVTGWPIWILLLIWVSCVGGGLAVVAPAYEILRETGGVGDKAGKMVLLFILGGIVILMPLLFQLFWGGLVVEVSPDELTVTWGRLRWPTKRIAFDDVTAMEAVTYRPIREFGGWGIRFGGGGKSAWTTRGSKALKVETKDGKVVYVGSDRPDRLLSRIAAAAGHRYEWAS